MPRSEQVMRFRLSFAWAAMCGLAVPLFAHIAAAQDAPSAEGKHEAAVAKRAPTKFLRVQRNEDEQPKNLQTSVVSYSAAQGDGKLVVDLVAAVHVGDKSSDDELTRRFANYAVVLYELVAPKAQRVPRPEPQRGDNPVSFLQNMTKSMLGLESQTELIDYTKDNFVHADMSPQEMREAMRKRGDDGLTLALGVMTDMLRQANLAEQRAQEQGAADALDPFSLLVDPQRSLKMKRMMAESFASSEDLEGGLGPTLQRMLIDDRNAAAMKVFQKELAKGHKRIAIFYGAAHMPDFEKRLMVDFGLKPDKTQWLTAWRMTGSNMGGGAPEDPLKDLLKLLDEATR